MVRIRVLVVSLLGVLAFGAISAAAAFAEETEFLESGSPVTVGALYDGEGEFLFADHKGGIFGEEVMILCSGEGLGEALSSTDGDVTALFALGATDPEGAGKVSCTVQAGICSSAVVTPVNLPWLVELMLEGAPAKPVGLVLSSGVGNPGGSLECSGVAEDTCTGEGAVEVKNEPGGTIDAFFNEQAGSCTRGGANSGLVEGLLLLLSVTAGLSIEVMGS